MQYSIIILVAVVAVASCLLWTVLFVRQTTSMMLKWAAGHGYEMIRCEIPLGFPLRAAALSLMSPAQVPVRYSVSLRDGTGHRRSGSAICGRFVGGVFGSDKIEITWSDAAGA